MTRQTEFDIALSFAGEDRPYVDEVANILKGKGIKIFYDKFEEANLWGKNLYDYLSDMGRPNRQTNFNLLGFDIINF